MTDQRCINDPTAYLHRLISGFHATYYVYIGVECGLFDALVDPQTPVELSSQFNLHERYVRRFCEIGLRWGLLDIESDSEAGELDTVPRSEPTDASSAFYLREPFVKPLAVPDAAQYMGNLFQFVVEYVGEEYLSYPEFLHDGQTRDCIDRGPTFTTTIEGTTRGLQTIFVEKLVPESLSTFNKQLSRGGRVLDIGCGTGHLACRLCERYSNLEVIGIDLDADAIERARERASALDVDDRTAFSVEDAATLELTDAIDAAVLFMSLHEIAPHTRDDLFERLGDALVDDGVVAVFDEIYPGHPSEFDQLPFASGVETQWSELIWGNDVPTEAEQRDLFVNAGLVERSRIVFADRFVAYEGERNQ